MTALIPNYISWCTGTMGYHYNQTQLNMLCLGFLSIVYCGLGVVDSLLVGM